jgi:hypothetical protein
MICSGLCRFLPLVVIEDLLAQTGLKTFITPGSDFQKQATVTGSDFLYQAL